MYIAPFQLTEGRTRPWRQVEAPTCLYVVHALTSNYRIIFAEFIAGAGCNKSRTAPPSPTGSLHILNVLGSLFIARQITPAPSALDNDDVTRFRNPPARGPGWFFPESYWQLAHPRPAIKICSLRARSCRSNVYDKCVNWKRSAILHCVKYVVAQGKQRWCAVRCPRNRAVLRTSIFN